MDQELVVRAKDGDPGAFRTLAIESHPRLFTAAFGILRDQAVTLGPGDAIFLPAIPADEVDEEAVLRVANPGSQEATAYTFHKHDLDGGPWLGFPDGVTLDGWDYALGLAPWDPFNGTDVHVRLSRLTGEPGTMIPVPEPPGVGLYYVESGVLDQVTAGPEREFTTAWRSRHNGSITSTENLEKTLEITGDGPASLLALAVVPVSTDR